MYGARPALRRLRRGRPSRRPSGWRRARRRPGSRHLLGTDQPGGPRRAGALRRLGPGGIPARRTTSPFAKQNPGAGMFFIRMLYSCLVAADFLDTEAFMSGKPRGSCSGCWKRRRLPSGHSDVPRPPSKPTERDSPHAESCRSLPGERGLKPRCWQSRRLRRRSLPSRRGFEFKGRSSDCIFNQNSGLFLLSPAAAACKAATRRTPWPRPSAFHGWAARKGSAPRTYRSRCSPPPLPSETRSAIWPSPPDRNA